MSGIEPLAFVGLVDACIGITGTIISISQAAYNANGLPKKLAKLFEEFPVVQDLFERAKENNANIENEKRRSAEPVLKQCKEELTKLQKLFEEICPKDESSRLRRIWNGAKAEVFGRNSRLLSLWCDIQSHLDTLEKQEIFDIGDKLDRLKETLESLAEEENGNIVHYGTGNQNVNTGNGPQYNQGGGSGNQFTQNFGIMTINQTPKVTSLEDHCLQSLAFTDMERRSDITPKVQGTCEWILDHAEYLKWLEHGGILWINGRPGTGKSTIMESILRSTSGATHAGVDSDPLVLSYFFYARGQDDLHHSELGLLRSLLHQLLSKSPILLSQFIQDAEFEERCRKKGEPGEKWHWTLSDLSERLVKYAGQFTSERPLTIYIDALDEGGAVAAKNLVQYFQQLREGQRKTLSQYNLSFCISCRPWPRVIFDWDYCIVVENENRKDIDRFVKAKLRETLKWNSEKELFEIELQIKGRALGTFQWVVMVVRRVEDLRNEDKDFIIAEIKKIPQQLGNVYEDMLKQLEGTDILLALRLLRWITFAAHPLTLTELRHAALFDPEQPSQSLDECRGSTHWCTNDQKMRLRLLRLSRGLVKLTGVGIGDVIVFEHESVQEYMSEYGIKFLESRLGEGSTQEGIALGRAHHLLSITCLLYLSSIRSVNEADLERLGEGRLNQGLCFVSYAAKYCMTHARAAEAQGYKQHDFIEISRWPSDSVWTDMQIFQFGNLQVTALADVDVNKHRKTLQHFACEHGLYSILLALLPRLQREKQSRRRRILGRLTARQKPLQAKIGGVVNPFEVIVPTPGPNSDSLNARDFRGRTPLIYAAAGGHSKLVQLLLDTGNVDVDVRDSEGATPLYHAIFRQSVVYENATPLYWATDRHSVEIVERLLAAEANPNIAKYGGFTPLHSAASDSSVELMQKLINANACIDTVDYWGDTALGRAAKNNNIKTMVTLLSLGADVNALPLNALEEAVEKGHVKVLEKLMDAGIDLTAFLTTGHEMETFIRNLSAIQISLLTTQMVSVEHRRSGKTILHWAAELGHKACVKRCLEFGARVNKKDKYGETPLHYAAERGHFGIVKLLVLAKSDMVAVDIHGRTPLMCAQGAAPGGEICQSQIYPVIIEYLTQEQGDYRSRARRQASGRVSAK